MIMIMNPSKLLFFYDDVVDVDVLCVVVYCIDIRFYINLFAIVCTSYAQLLYDTPISSAYTIHTHKTE